jgi:hypothetical protein
MNDRIQKLAEQAGYHPDVFEMCKPGMEKFAELIVKECMTVCADNACRAGGLNTQVGEDLYLASDLIKQHFGVEE